MSADRFQPGDRVRVKTSDRPDAVGTRSPLGVLDAADLECYLDRRVPEGHEAIVSQLRPPAGHVAPTHLSDGEDVDGWLYLEEWDDGRIIGYILCHPHHLERLTP